MRTNNPAVHATLSYLSTEPNLPGRKLSPVVLEVEEVGAFFRIDVPGLLPVEGIPEAITFTVYRLLSAWWRDDIADTAVVHAAAAEIDGKRIAFVGDKHAGKTTLMLRLIQDGYTVQGDENLVVTAEGTISNPRCLHIKEPSLDVLPALAEQIRSMPYVIDWNGNVIYSCPPSFSGQDWTIVEGPVDALVFLDPNFGGSSILSPLQGEHAFERLLENAFLPPIGRARAVARLRRLILGRSCWRLQTGNLDQAIDHLRRLASEGYGHTSANLR